MKQMRLVSALYQEDGPFMAIPVFNAFETVDNPDELKEGDVLVVWGGGDISPTLYNKAVGMAYASEAPSRRDLLEWRLMQQAKAMNIPIIGVCRGGQMITALQGGHLIQHVNNHSGGGHNINILKDNKELRVNSIHHQMMVPPANGEYEIIAVASPSLSDVYSDVDDSGNIEHVTMDFEPEFIYYPSIRGFAVQWHPEGMSNNHPTNVWLNSFIQKKLV